MSYTTATPAAAAAVQRKIISYTTDIEGDLKYFQRWLHHSKVLTATNVVHSAHHPKEWKSFDIDFVSPKVSSPEPHFVFGGDLFDHGPGDLRLSSSLLAFKQLYPDRVTLLLGNRDINKLRLLNELDAATLQFDPTDPRIFLPYWRSPKFVTSLNTHLEQIANHHAKKRTQQPEQPAHGPIDFVPKSWRKNKTPLHDEKVDTPVERLKWILKHTMGSMGAFEHRRHELSILQEQKHMSDEQVFNSFYQSVQPGGIVRNYLDATDVMKIHGETLFIHGALTATNVGRKPMAAQKPSNNDGSTTGAKDYTYRSTWEHKYSRAKNLARRGGLSKKDTIQKYKRHPTRTEWWGSEQNEQEWKLEWILKNPNPSTTNPRNDSATPYECSTAADWSTYLNAWKRKAMHTWWELPMDQKIHTKECKYPLIDYGVDGGVDSATVVYNSWLNKKHHPTENKNSRVNTFLKDSNIKRVVVGHQPHGDVPTLLRGEDYVVLMCDTSYCAGQPGDRHSRGTSCVEVIVEEQENACTETRPNEEGMGDSNKLPLSSVCNIHGLFNSASDGGSGSGSGGGQSSFDFIVEDHPAMGYTFVDECAEEWYIGHPLEDTNEYVAWKPGVPFPSNLEYKIVNHRTDWIGPDI